MSTSTSESGSQRGRLANRVAVVLGAGALDEGVSNGRAASICYAREGATVVCVDRILDRAELTASQIVSEGGKAYAFAANAVSGAEMEKLGRSIVEKLGRIDIMHNNVGAGGVGGDPATISEEDWDKEIAINLKSAYLGMRIAVPVMDQNGGGVITNISSTLAIRFMKGPNVAYAAAKAGVEAMTLACSLYYGARNIRVNAIRIGFSETPLVMASLRARVKDPERQHAALEKSRMQVPMGRHGTAWDVGAAAAFLASDEASYINGVILDVDGGLKNARL